MGAEGHRKSEGGGVLEPEPFPVYDMASVYHSHYRPKLSTTSRGRVNFCCVLLDMTCKRAYNWGLDGEFNAESVNGEAVSSLLHKEGEVF